MEKGTNVFVTGATGLIGGELVRALLTQPVGKVWALVRATHDGHPETRLANRLKRSAPCQPLPGAKFRKYVTKVPP